MLMWLWVPKNRENGAKMEILDVRFTVFLLVIELFSRQNCGLEMHHSRAASLLNAVREISTFIGRIIFFFYLANDQICYIEAL